MFKRTIYAVMLGIVCTGMYAQSPGITDFIKEQEADKVDSGMFITYRSDQHIYWQIPKSLDQREFAISTTLLTTPARPNRDMEMKFGYSGDMVGPLFFGLRINDDVVWITDPLHERVYGDLQGTFAQIAAQRGDERLYTQLPILAKDATSLLVEVDDLLKSFPLFTLEPVSFDLRIGSHLVENDEIKEIKGYDDRLLIRALRYYKNSSFSMPGKPSPPSFVGEWDTGICIQLLSEKPMEPLITSSGSYFAISKEYYKDDRPAEKRFYAKRWRLEINEADRERYMQGEKVAPIKPIIFYIDRNTPTKYVNSIIEGVRSWSAAFEDAGFKDAIDARLAPTPEEDPDFCIYDTNYPFISWKISGNNNAYGPTPCEPRSGEIINCHVAIFSSVLNLQQKWYFAQSGANDPQVWGSVVPDSLINQFIKQIVAHEIGHTLGLEHNFYASSHYSIDQLRDNDFLSQNSISTSVMDYVRSDYALRPDVDKVDLENKLARVSDYDKWAIEWGYRIFPGDNAKERTENRAVWNREKQKNPKNHFVGRLDVQSEAEDLGNDHVAFNAQGIENLKFLCTNPQVWNVTDKNSLYVWQGRYHSLISHYKQWTEQVLSHLGGKRTDKSDGNHLFIPEKAEYNRSVVQFIQRYILNPPVWLFDKELTAQIDIDGQKEFQKFYQDLMIQLIHALKKVDRSEIAGEDMLSIDEFLAEMHDELFSEWIHGGIVSEAKFEVQECYINEIIKLLEEPADMTSSNLLINVMQSLEKIKEDGSRYYQQTDNKTIKKQVAYLIDKIMIES